MSRLTQKTLAVIICMIMVLTSFAFVLPLGVSAEWNDFIVTVDNQTAGNLKNALESSLQEGRKTTEITTLNIKGTMNESDFLYLRGDEITPGALSNKIIKINMCETDITALPDYAFSNKKSYLSSVYNNLVGVDLQYAPALTVGKGAFENCESLEYAFISHTTVSIGEGAFQNCSNLYHINLNSVTSVGAFAFYGCEKYSEFYSMPKKLTSIGDQAFAYCNLSTVLDCDFDSSATFGTNVFKGANVQYLLFDDDKSPSDSFTWAGLTAFNHSGDFDGDGINNIIEFNLKLKPYEANDFIFVTIHNPVAGKLSEVLPSAVPEGKTTQDITSLTITGTMNDDDFKYLRGKGSYYEGGATPSALSNNIIEIDISGTDVTAIPDEAFRDYGSYKDITYSKLSTVLLPETLTSIGNYAFAGDDCLLMTSLPSGVTSIGKNAFENCFKLALSSLPNGLTSIEDCAFYSTDVTFTSLPDGITSIGNASFEHCSEIELTSLPSGLISVGFAAFQYCSSLNLSSLPSSLESIGEVGFFGCASMTIDTLPASLTSIGANAFEWCSSLPTVIKCEFDPSVVNGYKEFINTDVEYVLFPDDKARSDIFGWGGVTAVNHSSDFDGDGMSNIDEYNSGDRLLYVVDGYTLGDVNGDGKVSSADLVMLRKIVLGMISVDSLSKTQLAAANVDKSEETIPNASDYSALRKLVLGL